MTGEALGSARLKSGELILGVRRYVRATRCSGGIVYHSGYLGTLVVWVVPHVPISVRLKSIPEPHPEHIVSRVELHNHSR